LFHRDRGEGIAPSQVQVDAQGDRLVLSFAAGWLEDHPLTVADLEREQAYIANCGFDLQFA
ncbi:MAG: exopolyphosphatase, partial [Guyparkeria sp.]